MTLPVALLIACYKHESISQEIREIAGKTNLAVIESLSCKCKENSNKLRLVPPGNCCSDRASPTSDLGSESSGSSSVNTLKSYSYFSDINDVEEMLDGVFLEKTDVDFGRSLSVLVDIVENVTCRLNDGYKGEELKVKINYQKRDLLDLGKNIQGSFPLIHPADGNSGKSLDQARKFSIFKDCSMHDCSFQEVFP